MQGKEQENNTANQTVSPLVKEKTYGERMHDFIFGNLINFWLNLTVSAAYSFYVAHSIKPIKLPGMKEAKTTNEIQQSMGRFFERGLGAIKDVETRQRRGLAVAEVLTLLTPGFAIMIPSVWLGEKFKGSIVRSFDRKHYGADAENDPTIAARHAQIDAEAKPTLLGTVIARFATMGISMGTGAVIGSEGNLIQKLGQKHDIKPLAGFNGVNQFAGEIGTMVGNGIQQAAPMAVGRLNNGFLSEPRFSHSPQQLIRDAGLASTRYNQGLQNFARYMSMDVLYTIITSAAIHPVVRAIRVIPGMSYHTPVAVQSQQPLPRLRADQFYEKATEQGDTAPKVKISDVKHLDRVSDAALEKGGVA